MTQQTLQYVINANAAGFVSAIGQAEAKYSQALQGMSDKASRIQLFEKTQESAKQAAQEFFKLKEQTASYQLALAGARAPLQQFQQAMAAVELATRQSAVEVGHQRSALKPLEEALKTATSAYTSIRKEAIRAGGTAEDFAGEIAQAKRQLDSATTALSQHKAAMEKSASEYTANKEALTAYKSQLASVTKPVKDLENQLATTERQLVQTELKMRAGTMAVSGLRRELSAAGVDTHNLSAEQERMAAVVASTSQRINQARKLDSARSTLGVQSTSDIEREIVRIQASYARLAQSGTISMSEQMRAAQAARNRIAELKSELYGDLPATSFLHTSAGRLASMAAAVVSLNAAIGLTRNILSTAGEFETLRVQLDSVEKSAQKGKASFDYIKDLAVNTPFQVTNLTQAYIRLKNFGIDPTSGAMQAAVDQAAKLGGSQETLERITLALGQAWSKEKLQGEEALQLIEAGVPVWELLSSQLGRGAAELQTMASNGQLGKDAITALMAAMEKDSAGAAAAQMNTWNGVVSNAIDLWQQFLDEIGQAGLLDFAKGAILDLTNALAKMKETGELSQIAHNIAEALSALGKIAIQTSKFLIEHKDAIEALAAVYIGLKAKSVLFSLTGDMLKFADAAQKAAKWIKEIKNAETVGDILDLATKGKKSGASVSTMANKGASTAREYKEVAEGVIPTIALGKAALPSGADAAAKATASTVATDVEVAAAKTSLLTRGIDVAKAALAGLSTQFTAFGLSAPAGIIALGSRLTIVGGAVYGLINIVQLGKLAWEQYSAAVVEPKNRLDALHRSMSDTKWYAATVLESVNAIDQMTEAQRKHYLEMIKLAQKYWQAKTQELAETKGADSPEARHAASMAIAYTKEIGLVNDYAKRRLAIETTLKNNIEAVRKGQLATLAESLAKEQKLYDQANDQLGKATEARKKHQDSWAERNATDPAAKAKAPEDMGVTDYFEGKDKAVALSNKAAEAFDKYKKSGSETDLRQYQRDAAAAEKAFDALADTISKLREAGKITEGEFKFFNDQAGKAQDSFDAKTEKDSKENLQSVTEKLEALRQAAERVKNLKISIDGAEAITELDAMMAKFQQAAEAKPIQIPVQFIGPDGKLLQEARKDLGQSPIPGITPAVQAHAEGGEIAGPGTGTSDSILSWLSNGEFVVRAAAVQHYGPELLHALNQQKLPRFASGGLVANLPAFNPLPQLPRLKDAPASASGANLRAINFHFPGQSDPVPLSGSEDAVKQLVAAAKLMNLKRG